MNIHPTALVDPGAQLDGDVEVQAYSIIGPHVQIGAGTVVGPHVVIEGRTVIGRNNHFYSGTQIGVLSQDLKHKKGLIGRTTIGDRNIFREHVIVSASTMQSYDEEHRVTSIGNDCMFMGCSHVAHDCHVGSHVIMANCAVIAGHVDIEDMAILGGLSAVHQECVVGRLALVGGLCAVSKDVPPFMIVNGNPGRCRGVNTIGLRRRGIDEARRAQIKEIHRIMFRSDLNTTQALHHIETLVEESEERNHFLEFVRKSIRGITK
jgi:UDP-N-acetylglucosamine acyltransferase